MDGGIEMHSLERLRGWVLMVYHDSLFLIAQQYICHVYFNECPQGEDS
jgi:hypothetical protein